MLLLLSVASLFLLSTSTSTNLTTSKLEISQDELNYLQVYNYMEASAGTAGAVDNENREIYDAIIKLQTYFKLKVTGFMTEETRNSMKMPRCGVPDFSITTKDDFNEAGTKWNKKMITWKVVKYTNKVSRAELIDVIKYSLNIWADVADITFKYTPFASSADMEIGFYLGKHLGEFGKGFDGQGHVLAHAYYPNTGSEFAGDTHLDDAEDWAINAVNSDNKKSLAYVFVHEFGHALGIRHSNVHNSIMQPRYPTWVGKIVLHRDDIAAIQNIYGKKIYTTKRYYNYDVFCKSNGIDAAIEHSENSYLIFKDSKVRKITILGDSITLNVRDLFKGSLIENVKINAVIKTSETYKWRHVDGQWRNEKDGSNSTFVFQGSKIHSFVLENGIYYETGVNHIRNFHGIPINIDAAFTWSGNQKLYIIKGERYYRMSTTGNGFFIDNGFPRHLSEWRGLPSRIDAALHMNQFDKTMFFSGNHYYMFDDATMSVNKSIYPRLNKQDWLGC